MEVMTSKKQRGKSTMAACRVCNKQTSPDESQNAVDVAGLHPRLEKVLNESVPLDIIMCASCQFDLAQIEMYYALLTAFKKRYAETSKLWIQDDTCLNESTKSNTLHETIKSSSNNLLSVFGTETSGIRSPFDSDAAKCGVQPKTSTSFDSFEISDIKEEVQGDKPLQAEVGSITDSDETEVIKEDPSFTADTTWEPDEDDDGNESPNMEEPEELTVTSDIPAAENLGQDIKKQCRSRKNPNPSRTLVSPNKLRDPGKSDQCDVASSVEMAPTSRQAEQPNCSSVMRAKKRGRRKPPSSISKLDPTYEPKPSKRSSAVSVGGEPTEKRKGGRPRKEKGINAFPVESPEKRGKPKVAGPKQEFPCTICDKVFPQQFKLRLHMQNHAGHRPFPCTVCHKTFRAISHLNAHMKIHSAERPFKCDICNKAFIRKVQLVRHSVKHSDIRPYPCDQCDKRFKTKQQVRDHIERHHIHGRQCLCNVCGKSFFSEADLKLHIQTHSDVREKPFVCDICGKDFSNKYRLKYHKVVHESKEDREKHLCSICGKEYLQAQWLKLHMAKHKGESKYFCTHCGQYFTSNTEYERHMLIHQDLKPYQCSQCGKGFRTANNLKVHMSSHTDERPHKCTCGQSFRQTTKLKKHMKTQKHREFELRLAQSATAAAKAAVTVPDQSVYPDAPSVAVNEPVVRAPPPLMAGPTLLPTGALPLTVGDQHEMIVTYQAPSNLDSLGLPGQNHP